MAFWDRAKFRLPWAAKGTESIPLPHRNTWGQFPNWRSQLAYWQAKFQPIDPAEAREGRDNAIVNICINWIATSWQVATPEVFTVKPDGTEQIVEAHPFLEILNRPSSDLDSAQLLWALITDYVCRGNAYCHILKNNAGVPIGLEYIPSKWVRPMPNALGRIDYYRYEPQGSVFELGREEILHIRHGVNMGYPLEGVSPIASLFREIVTDNCYSDYAAGLARSGGIPPIVFSPRQTPDGMMGMTGDEAREIADKFNEKLKSNPGETRFLPGSVEMHKTGITPDQMALVDVRAIPETRIPAALGLPSALLQLYTGLAKSTMNNLNESIQQGWRGGIIPMMQIFARAITTQVLYQFPDAKTKKLTLRWNTSLVPELADDMIALRAAAREDVKVGILTIDEAREQQHLDALASAPAATTPAIAPSEVAKALPSLKVSAPAGGGNIYTAAEYFRRALASNEQAVLDALAGEWAKAQAGIDRELSSVLTRIAEIQDSGEEPSAYLNEFARRLDKLSEQIGNQLEGLADKGAAVIEDGQRVAVRTTINSSAAMARAAAGTPPPGLLMTWNTLPVEAFEALFGLASDGSPLSFLLTEMAGDYAVAVRTGLLTSIAKGEGPRQAAARVAAATGTSRARMETIARTEMLRASREASRRTYAANADVLDGYIRISAMDVNTCPACWALHGTKSAFSEIMASHPNCRCTMAPLPKSYAEILGDPSISDTRPKVVSGEDVFAALPETDQLAILGPGRMEQYRSGVPLSEFASVEDDPQWGPTMRVPALSETAR